MLAWLVEVGKTFLKLGEEFYVLQSKKSYLRYFCSIICSCLGCLFTLVFLFLWLFYYRVFLFTGRINTLSNFNHDLDFSHVQWGDISPFLKFANNPSDPKQKSGFSLLAPPTSMKYVFDKRNPNLPRPITSYDDFYLQHCEITVLSNLNYFPDETIYTQFTPNSPKKPIKDEEISPNRMINSQQYLFISTTQTKRVSQKLRKMEEEKLKHKSQKKRTAKQIEEERDTFKQNEIMQVLMELKFMKKPAPKPDTFFKKPKKGKKNNKKANYSVGGNDDHEEPRFFNVHLVLKDSDSNVLFWVSRKVLLAQATSESTKYNSLISAIHSYCKKLISSSISLLMDINNFVMSFFEYQPSASYEENQFSSSITTQFVDFLHKNDTYQIRKFNDLFENSKSVLVLIDDPSVLIVSSKLHFFSDFGGFSKFFYVHTVTSFVLIFFISLCCCGCLWSFTCCLCVFCDRQKSTKIQGRESESEDSSSSEENDDNEPSAPSDDEEHDKKPKPKPKDEKDEPKPEEKKEELKTEMKKEVKKEEVKTEMKKEVKEEKKKKFPVEEKEKEKKQEKKKVQSIAEFDKQKEESESEIEFDSSDSD